MSKTTIKGIKAREILSAGSFPAVEAEVILQNGISASASCPRGTSAGKAEPKFLLDGDARRYHKRGMLKAVEVIETKIAKRLHGKDAADQAGIDALLRKLDPTPDINKLGVNSILPVSLACARAASISEGVPLYKYLRPMFSDDPIESLPKPMVVVIEGGAHADRSTDFQEYLIIGMDADPRISIRHCAEVYQKLREVLQDNDKPVNVGYEGAYAFTGATSNEQPLGFIKQAVAESKLELGTQIALALDCAASEFGKRGEYKLESEKRVFSAEDLITTYSKLLDNNPELISIEDGLGEDDWTGWEEMYHQLGHRCQIVGDDITVTNKKLVQKAIKKKAINALLVKPNQAGTLTSTVEAVKAARAGGCKIIVSHRGGGETNDTFIVDLAIACGAEYIKCGISRGERVAKYNYLMKAANLLL